MDRIRGSINIPLDNEGLKATERLGQAIGAAGGFDELHSSDMVRAQQTASALLRNSPNTKLASVTGALQPWHLGGLEGQPSNSAVPQALQFSFKEPDTPIPGQAPDSTAPGESFNQFKQRVLSAITPILGRHLVEPKKVGIVTHFRDAKLVQAWLRAGARPDHSIDPQTFAADDLPPGSLMRIYPEGGRWTYEMRKPEEGLPPGVYLLRHEKTGMNG